MSKQPEVGDTVYIVGTIDALKYGIGTTERQVARVKTSRPVEGSNEGEKFLSDSFLVYVDQIALIEPPEEVEECAV